ncbi:sulfatase-like hydrolase/transferase [Halorarius halobius]|uniref:sulfatase-like hydrolase/transferase n=1 Tax=Halorarius halobius TaxID=2962671 RepID=UPI0020CD3968|nr:sulfatase-like hydrolase/transferase [Halorarius halobius]
MGLGAIENVVLFVGDAVRFDKSVNQLSKLGPTCRTISASLHTPASFGSLLTGLNVPAHGITGFQNVLPKEIPSLLELNGINTAFSDKTGTMHEDMHRIFRTDARASLDEIQSPFIWIARDPGGHAPYDGYDGETYDQMDENASEYFSRVAGDIELIERDYQRGVRDSVSRFKQCVETIRKRGLADETLLIYTSDHGELLGEYGLLGHNHVACPELVYVPTTFVHPKLEPGQVNQLFRNIDIVPTVLDLIERKSELPLDGVSYFEEGSRIGYNHFEMTFYNNGLLSDFSNKVRSCWDEGGGHVFVESGHRDSIAIYLGLLANGHKGKHILKTKNILSSGRKFLPGYEVYGSPNISKHMAKSYIEDTVDRTINPTVSNLNEDTQDRLEDLGYL